MKRTSPRFSLSRSHLAMNRTMLKILFVLVLGAGLGYLAAAGRVDAARSALADSEGGSRSSQASACPEGKTSCSDGATRSSFLALATTAVLPGSAAAVQDGKKPNI